MFVGFNEISGWIGAICLALCALPQAIKSYKTKKAEDISGIFLILWLIGELLTLIYVAPTFQWPLIVNYLLNLFFIGIICKYKWFYKE